MHPFHSVGIGVQKHFPEHRIFDACKTVTTDIGNKLTEIMDMSQAPDYYLCNRPKRPKFDIAQYVSSQNILVPRHFSDIDEALDSILDRSILILRSEHPQDYDGRSGDLPSWEIHKKEGEKFEVYSEGQKTSNSGKNIDTIMLLYSRELKKVCTDIGIDPEQVSYSVWEYIPGDNYAIVADMGVLGRYHIYEKKQSAGKLYKVLDIDKNDKIPSLYQELISQYEKVRNFERFDPKNCPIMEFQHSCNIQNEQEIYFLQYLRTRNQNICDWKLDREMELGEIKARFVRGVTPPEGIIMPFDTEQLRFDVSLNEFCQYPQKHNEGYVLSSNTASLSRNNNTLNASIESLVQGYKAICMVIDRATEAVAQGDIWKILQDHTGRSFIHKPEISLAINHDDGKILFPGLNRIKEHAYIRVVSDGDNAFLKRVDLMI
ncbi:hypothetical protein GW819_02440 [Candidatus Gracilibacteria bacterium]|nr:hypothetical protein [Candidatus Gracilibacteria bacterium]OIO76114.1 MAG: hypothetical protein AUJ87_03475 [Candidatus Gracilibacteria bacterium CG1_02_38_174]PIQ10698.1 MAG: hypothetical protein COW68_04070 [Candidatus Gracilibacteria bacterium CG18_big_fil_WC_8_21_14_2_50_38_16]PIQ42170.1 MAG: hypothetical protein COW06_00575 [Candidatus Gracilibacteria bacterium CG12_big_fil_rev_8_21_14_0_65_38_15]PIZ01801.1 MAG: hypothetical protein COY60_01645 [Candidatus Gracilibacteria bacterium CG_4